MAPNRNGETSKLLSEFVENWSRGSFIEYPHTVFVSNTNDNFEMILWRPSYANFLIWCASSGICPHAVSVNKINKKEQERKRWNWQIFSRC